MDSKFPTLRAVGQIGGSEYMLNEYNTHAVTSMNNLHPYIANTL